MKIKELQAKKWLREKQLPLNVFMQCYDAPSIEWHRHADFYELVVVCSGSARNELPEEMESVLPGCVFLMPPQAVHRYTGIRDFRHYNILFSQKLLNTGSLKLEELLAASELFRFGRSGCSPLLFPAENTLSQIILMLETIRSELAVQSPGWREAAFSEFIRMMVCLIRSCGTQDTGKGQYAYQIGCAVRRMEEHPERVFTLKMLADSVGMSESCFRHHFSAVTGFSPIQYLIRLRLRKALLHLTLPGNITGIAMLCGFEDQNYFARLFRKQFGIAPGKFREQCIAGNLSVSELLAGLMGSDPQIGGK